MLAGIRDIVLFLNNSKKDRMKKIVSGLKKYGLNISLSIIDEEISDIRDCEAFRELESKEKIMLIEGLDFIFCKDLTRTLRRIMQESETPVRLTDFNKQPLSVCFYPEKHNQDIHRHQLYSLGRGVCTFRIDGMDSLWDASVLMRIIENHQHEKIGSIEDIARNKHFI